MLRRSLIALAGAVLLSAPASAQSPKTLRVVMHSDLKILDPVWTTAYIVRNHGYLIYDTLFAIDGKFEPQPQMVESWTVSDDKLTWTFKLRDGLKWHDGTPVTSADVMPSIKRWTEKDALGGLLAKSTQEMKAVDDRTFQIVLKEPFGMMLKALAKSASVPLFVMPKRVAETPVAQQISDTTGSGPFIFKKDEWKAGEKVVYVRNPDYKPRAEPPSGLAGGKVAKLDRIEWRSIPDPQTAVNALMSGEIDMIETVAHDLLPVLEKDKNVEIVVLDPLGLHLRAALQLEAAAVQRRALPPRRDALAQPEGLPAGGDRRSALLQGMQGDVRLRHAARDLGRHAGPAGVALRGVAQAPEGAGLRRHADRRAADQRQPGADQPRAGHQDPARARRLQGRRAVDGLADPGGAPRQEGSRATRAAGTSRRPRRRPCCCSIRSTTTMPRRAAIAPSSAGRSTRRSRSSGCSSSARAIPRSSSRSPRRSRRASSSEGVTVPLGQFQQPMARRKTVSGNVVSPVTVFWNVEKK